MNDLMEIFGDPISVYTREEAIEDGALIDVTEWASADKGFHGGFTVPVVMTRSLWARVEAPKRSHQDTRGRAHDVLWMASLAARAAGGRGSNRAGFVVKVGNRNLRPIIVIDGDGVTIGFPQDF